MSYYSQTWEKCASFVHLYNENDCHIHADPKGIFISVSLCMLCKDQAHCFTVEWSFKDYIQEERVAPLEIELFWFIQWFWTGGYQKFQMTDIPVCWNQKLKCCSYDGKEMHLVQIMFWNSLQVDVKHL